MSQSKKRKKNTVCRKPPRSYIDISKHYFDYYVKVVHKIMTMMGIDTNEFDALTKRTKIKMMRTRLTPYHIIAAAKSTVPRAYIEFFNYMMTHYEKNTYYGDPAFNVTYMEYVTIGLSFSYSVRNHDEKENIISDNCHQRLEKIKEQLVKYEAENENDSFVVRINKLMQQLTMFVSSPNYRFYTSKEGPEIDYLKCVMQNRVVVSSFEPEKRYFKVKGEYHSSYQLWHYNIFPDQIDPNPLKTEIPIPLMEEDSFEAAVQKMNKMETIDMLPVYIQNHALHRIRQRLDSLDNLSINTVFSVSFMLPKFSTAITGQRMIRAVDISTKTVGYFPFIKQDGAILILSFLPLSSPITPEGSVLHKELGIKIDDSNYIGLDKLSFYLKTDFETLPKLKQALINANMWHLTQIKTEEVTERKDDQILKRFFTEYNPEEQQTSTNYHEYTEMEMVNS